MYTAKLSHHKFDGAVKPETLRYTKRDW